MTNGLTDSNLLYCLHGVHGQEASQGVDVWTFLPARPTSTPAPYNKFCFTKIKYYYQENKSGGDVSGFLFVCSNCMEVQPRPKGIIWNLQMVHFLLVGLEVERSVPWKF